MCIRDSFYTLDVTEQRMLERMLERVSSLDYDVITEIDLTSGTYRLAVCRCV